MHTRQIAKKCWIVLLLVAMLTSCQVETPTQNNDTVADTEMLESAGPLDGSGLEKRDFGGRTYNIVTSKPPNDVHGFGNFEITAEAINGEILNDTIYNRNLTVQELLSVQITEAVVEQERTAEFITQAVLSDERLYDLSFARAYEVGALSMDGMFADLNALPHINFDNEWWNKGLIDTAEVGGHVTFGSSSFDLHSKKRIYIMLYNDDMAQDYGITGLIDMAKDGTWTLDKEIEYCELVAADTNGDGKMGLEDRYGLITGDDKDLYYYNIAAGNRIAAKDESGKIVLTMSNERTITLIDTFMSLMNSDDAVFPRDFQNITTNFYDDTYNIFWAGNALFQDSIVGSLASASEKAEFAYKILPLPKLDAEQDRYYTMSDNIGLLFGVPVNAPDPDFAGYMLEAMSCLSHTTTLPAYYEVCCKKKAIWDEDSAAMLDMVLAGETFDVGYLYSIGGLSDVLSWIIPLAHENIFASQYAAREKNALADLEKINDALITE